jgi:hypothetical protein
LIRAGDNPSEIRAADWRAMFQRRVVDPSHPERSPNRGVLPCFVFRPKLARPLVMVPLADTEALWIAVTCGRCDFVRGRTAQGDPLVASLICRLGDRSKLLRIDAVRRHGQSHCIDRRAVTVSRSPSLPVRASMTVTIRSRNGREVFDVALVAPRLYERLSRRRAPPPSRPEDAYAGWRLP